MFEVTDRALRYLSELIARRGGRDITAIRLLRRARRIELRPDDERRGDLGFVVDARTVLVVDRALADAMRGLRLDVRRGEAEKPELHLSTQ
ncbi:MAG: hypothetical protein KDB80_02750 [Planctomycetes bacterium]|nr:hypothetical protein [Planctomycetota bacterium]